jgi:hypothetical protein
MSSPAIGGAHRGIRLRLGFVLVAATLATAGCSWLGLGSSSAPANTASTNASEETLKKNCTDEKWKEENLGLWYSVCRQPLRW